MADEEVICFFCLRKTKEYRVVSIYVRDLDMQFRVFACRDCILKGKARNGLVI